MSSVWWGASSTQRDSKHVSLKDKDSHLPGDPVDLASLVPFGRDDINVLFGLHWRLRLELS